MSLPFNLPQDQFLSHTIETHRSAIDRERETRRKLKEISYSICCCYLGSTLFILEVNSVSMGVGKIRRQNLERCFMVQE